MSLTDYNLRLSSLSPWKWRLTGDDGAAIDLNSCRFFGNYYGIKLFINKKCQQLDDWRENAGRLNQWLE